MVERTAEIEGMIPQCHEIQDKDGIRICLGKRLE
jgi:hypothetical protein